MSIMKGLHIGTIAGASHGGFRVGVIQFGNKAYTECELGATRNLRDITSRLLHIKYRNDDYNDVSGALEAGIHMLVTR